MDDPGDEKVMTVVEHLSELRRRLFISILAVVIASIVGYFLAPDLIRILKDQAPLDKPLVFTTPGGAFFLIIKLSLMVGIALASPIVLYELWALRFAWPDAQRAAPDPAVGTAVARDLHGARRRRRFRHFAARRRASCSVSRYPGWSSR